MYEWFVQIVQPNSMLASIHGHHQQERCTRSNGRLKDVPECNNPNRRLKRLQTFENIAEVSKDEMDLNEGIKAFASTISRQPLGLALHRPETWAEQSRCFENVNRKVYQDGGAIRFGWTFHHRLVIVIPGTGYLMATHHAVWHAPNGQLIDVTPFHLNPQHHPLTSQKGSVLFLVDDVAKPVIADRLVAPWPLRFFPLSEDTRLISHVERLHNEEQRKCREIYESHE